MRLSQGHDHDGNLRETASAEVVDVDNRGERVIQTWVWGCERRHFSL
jgi:hypothetical protein